MIEKLKFGCVASVLLLSAPVFAQAVPPTNAEPKVKEKTRMVCEVIEETGTRLGARKVCMTDTQWRDKRAQQREDIERAQRNVGIANGQ